MAEQKQRLTFISYSRADSEFALELAKELRSSGFYIWLDQLDIPTGVRWDDEVERALLACDIFMVILTPDSIASNNVKDEIGYAIDSNKRILPVLLENAVLPFRLRRFQYVDFTKKSYDEGIDAAKQLLRKLLGEQTSAPPDSPAIPSAKPAIEQQRAKAIEQAGATERIERERKARAAPPATSVVQRKVSVSRGQPVAKNIPILAGAGLFSIVCLVAGWMILRPWILPPALPATEAPISTEATISATPLPTSTFTPTITMEPSFTPSATSTPTVTPFAPQEPQEFIIWFFNTLIKENKFDLAWSLLTPDFNKPKFEDWKADWAAYDDWTVSDLKATYSKDNFRVRVSGNYVFGPWKAGTITYCLVRDKTRNTWMFDAKKNCPQ